MSDQNLKCTHTVSKLFAKALGYLKGKVRLQLTARI